MAGLPYDEWGPHPEEFVQLAREQMDAFAAMLEGREIRVDRPTPLDFGQKVQTPDWEQECMYTCMPPRDILVCVGSEIIEASMSQRSRWYEYLCYRPLLEQYFKEDPNFDWSAAPKPRLTDESFREDYWDTFWNVWDEEERLKRMRSRYFKNTDKEPLWDAADVMRFGKDIFVQICNPTTEQGIEWLRRHLEPKGFRLHEVQFGGKNPVPWHIDADIFAPRPGLLFQNPYRPPLTSEFHELFRINDWEIVDCAPPAREKPYERSPCSIYLAYNVFSLDPNTICVDAGEVHLIEQLDKLSFEVVAVEFIAVSPFGGGLHCSTVDIYREGACEDYFPKQIEGY
jgi:glycine amidinotransferase